MHNFLAKFHFFTAKKPLSCPFKSTTISGLLLDGVPISGWFFLFLLLDGVPISRRLFPPFLARYRRALFFCFLIFVQCCRRCALFICFLTKSTVALLKPYSVALETRDPTGRYNCSPANSSQYIVSYSVKSYLIVLKHCDLFKLSASSGFLSLLFIVSGSRLVNRHTFLSGFLI